jgi:hypothetical protein
MDIQESILQRQQFRHELYQAAFEARADALMDLMDALSSNGGARSVVELSLSPFFRFGYSSLYDAIDSFFQASDPEKGVEERQKLEQTQMGRSLAICRSRSSGGTGCLGWMGRPYPDLGHLPWKTAAMSTSPK